MLYSTFVNLAKSHVMNTFSTSNVSVPFPHKGVQFTSFTILADIAVLILKNPLSTSYETINDNKEI